MQKGATMIEGIDIERLKRRIRIEHPRWADAGVHADARRILATFDPRLKTALARYVHEGIKTPCRGKGISTHDAMANTGCTYLEALDAVSTTIEGRR
jgi:hypothetical protein